MEDVISDVIDSVEDLSYHYDERNSKLLSPKTYLLSRPPRTKLCLIISGFYVFTFTKEFEKHFGQMNYRQHFLNRHIRVAHPLARAKS